MDRHLLKLKGFVASVPTHLKLIVAGLILWTPVLARGFPKLSCDDQHTVFRNSDIFAFNDNIN